MTMGQVRLTGLPGAGARFCAVTIANALAAAGKPVLWVGEGEPPTLDGQVARRTPGDATSLDAAPFLVVYDGLEPDAEPAAQIVLVVSFSKESDSPDAMRVADTSDAADAR
jgi:hypothetical protein